MRPLLTSLCLLTTVALAQAPNPGRATFESRCARCHGGDATGGESGPNIVAQIGARSDADLAAFLRQGRPSNGMPAFDLPAQEMTALIAHLRTLLPISRNNPQTPIRKRVETTDGQTIEGIVLAEGITDLALRTGAGGAPGESRIRLLRKAPGGRYRVVTSQTDWPTYHGDPSGNRYSKLTQIDRSNVARLAPKWVFPIPGVSQVENTPLVVEGIMYVSSANEVYALDAGTGRQLWHYQRARTRGLAGNATI